MLILLKFPAEKVVAHETWVPPMFDISHVPETPEGWTVLVKQAVYYPERCLFMHKELGGVYVAGTNALEADGSRWFTFNFLGSRDQVTGSDKHVAQRQAAMLFWLEQADASLTETELAEGSSELAREAQASWLDNFSTMGHYNYTQKKLRNRYRAQGDLFHRGFSWDADVADDPAEVRALRLAISRATTSGLKEGSTKARERSVQEAMSEAGVDRLMALTDEQGIRDAQFQYTDQQYKQMLADWDAEEAGEATEEQLERLYNFTNIARMRLIVELSQSEDEVTEEAVSARLEAMTFDEIKAYSKVPHLGEFKPQHMLWPYASVPDAETRTRHAKSITREDIKEASRGKR